MERGQIFEYKFGSFQIKSLDPVDIGISCKMKFSISANQNVDFKLHLNKWMKYEYSKKYESKIQPRNSSAINRLYGAAWELLFFHKKSPPFFPLQVQLKCLEKLLLNQDGHHDANSFIGESHKEQEQHI